MRSHWYNVRQILTNDDATERINADPLFAGTPVTANQVWRAMADEDKERRGASGRTRHKPKK
jgi:hypothetical protein